MNRDTNLDRVKHCSEPWDIIVIGGGAAGVGCAVDAASRGLKVLLLEQHDFGKGTSSRSTKLIHGGVRYLAQGGIPLVRESLKERSYLLANAPHVVHTQEFVVPCCGRWQQIYYGAGLKFYDLLAGRRSLGRTRFLSRSATLRLLPGIKPDRLTGGIAYFDGQFDDARLLIDLARTAEKFGAALLNYAKVTSIGADNETLRCVTFKDALTGERHSANARFVINATGAFCDQVRGLADPRAEQLVTLSQGIHLVLERSFLPGDAALMLPKTSDGRVLFAIPWHDHVVVGTTDTPVANAELEPEALEAEIEFVLETAAGCLSKEPTRADVLSVFAGIRALVSSSAVKNTSRLSRGHTIVNDGPRMITVTGGKWTTYRRMAEDAVDTAVEMAGLRTKASATKSLSIDATPQSAGSDSGKRIHPDLPYTSEDVLRAVRSEMAQTVEDVLSRRTRCLFLNAKAAVEAAPVVAEIMAKELGKDGDWIKSEIADFEKTARGYIIS